MKKIILLLAAVVGLHSATIAEDGNGKATIDAKASSFKWVGEKVAGAHNGTVDIQSGALEMDGDKIVGGSFIINMTTIKCNDLEGEWADKLVGHLKSPDFFNVAEHSTANFNITKAVDNGKGKYTITGSLTIKGISHEISFPAKVSMDGSKVTATADFAVNRTKWDIKYGSGSFFDNLGDKAISDDFKVKINLVASK